MVGTYAAGRHAEALADLAGWTDAELRTEIEAVRELAEEARRCAACEARRTLETLPLRAAVLLHTERDIRVGTPASGTEEFSPVCGRRMHDVLAERLLDALPRTTASKAFARRWYRAMIFRTHWDLCSEDAAYWARGGLKWSPADAELVLARGTAEELNEVRRLPVPAAGRGPDPTVRKPRKKLDEARRDLLLQARSSFREALAIDPDAHEARLRLGRVSWRLGRMDEARSALKTVVAHAPDRRRLYLAHLFLGQVEEDEGRVSQADEHYRKALEIEPASQAAGVALSQVRFLLGDLAGARQTLDRALRAASHRSEDAFWSYRAGDHKKVDAILAELREEMVR